MAVQYITYITQTPHSPFHCTLYSVQSRYKYIRSVDDYFKYIHDFDFDFDFDFFLRGLEYIPTS